MTSIAFILGNFLNPFSTCRIYIFNMLLVWCLFFFFFPRMSEYLLTYLYSMNPNRLKTQRDCMHSASCSWDLPSSGFPLLWFGFQAFLMTSSNSASVHSHWELEQSMEGSHLYLILTETWAYKTDGLQWTPVSHAEEFLLTYIKWLYCPIMMLTMSLLEIISLFGAQSFKKV